MDIAITSAPLALQLQHAAIVAQETNAANVRVQFGIRGIMACQSSQVISDGYYNRQGESDAMRDSGLVFHGQKQVYKAFVTHSQTVLCTVMGGYFPSS